MSPEQSTSNGPTDDRQQRASQPGVDTSADAETEGLPAAPSISTSDLFQALSVGRCRYVLTYLLRESRPVPVYELAEYVVTCIDAPEGYTTAEFRGRVATELLHTTCPKLDDIGLVQFDRKHQMIRETQQTVVALPHLRIALKRADVAAEE